MTLYCFIKTIWCTALRPGFYTDGIPIEGHSYGEIYNNKDIQVLMCEDCGKVSFGWK